MHGRAVTLAMACLAAGLSSCSTRGNVYIPRCEEEALLQIPTCAAEIDKLEGQGEACGTTVLDDSYSYSRAIRVEGAKPGECTVVLQFKDGTSSQGTVTFTQSQSCGYVTGWFSTPPSFHCPDAGPCPGQTGSFLWPAYARCSLYCPTTDAGIGCAAPIVGVPPVPGNDVVCACGVAEMDAFFEGCTTDGDCVLSIADCCGCERGGASYAIPRYGKDKWEYNWCRGVDAGCNGPNVCGNARAVCDRGRCAVVK